VREFTFERVGEEGGLLTSRREDYISNNDISYEREFVRRISLTSRCAGCICINGINIENSYEREFVRKMFVTC